MEFGVRDGFKPRYSTAVRSEGGPEFMGRRGTLWVMQTVYVLSGGGHARIHIGSNSSITLQICVFFEYKFHGIR